MIEKNSAKKMLLLIQKKTNHEAEDKSFLADDITYSIEDFSQE